MTPKRCVFHIMSTVEKNIECRQDLILDAHEDQELQRRLYDECKNNIIFFFDYFLWAFNPKSILKNVPIVLHPRQREHVLKIHKEIVDGVGSATEKSREVLATYMHLGVYIHCWLFTDGFEGLCLSKGKDDVDDKTTSSLFGKLRYMVDRLPFWLRPKRWIKRDHGLPYMKIYNPDNGNWITGRATTEDTGVSGRKSVVLIDEAALINQRIYAGLERGLQEVTNTIRRVSTPRGVTLMKQIIGFFESEQ